MPPIRSNQLSCRSLELTTHKTHIQKRRLPCSRVLYGDVGFGSINMNMGARLSPRAILRTHSIQTTSSFFSKIILFFIFREKREYESQRRNPRKSGRTWRHAARRCPEDGERTAGATAPERTSMEISVSAQHNKKIKLHRLCHHRSAALKRWPFGRKSEKQAMWMKTINL